MKKFLLKIYWVINFKSLIGVKIVKQIDTLIKKLKPNSHLQ